MTSSINIAKLCISGTKKHVHVWQRRVIRSMMFPLLFIAVVLGSRLSFTAFCNSAPKPPLIAAILSSNTAEAHLILESCPQQVSVPERRTGLTPLHYAVHKGSVKLVKMLFAAGGEALASVRDKRGRIPLHIAAVRGSFAIPKFPLSDISPFPEIMECLVKAYRKVNIKDNNGNTPLLLAAQCGSWDTAYFLIAHGAVVNETNDKGQAPLHTAVIHDHVRIVCLLMQGGAHAHRRDNEQNTPITLARGKEYLLVLLRDFPSE